MSKNEHDKIQAALELLAKRLLPLGVVPYRVEASTSNVAMWLREFQAEIPKPDPAPAE